MRLFEEHLQNTDHLSPQKIAQMFRQHIEDLPPFEKENLARVHKDLYNILKDKYRRDPQRLHDIVNEIPEIKKRYNTEQNTAHNKKMMQFTLNLQRDYPTHKTYDETSEYIKHFLQHITPHEKEHAEKILNEVLDTLKMVVRDDAKECDNDLYKHCAYAIGRITTRIPEFASLHQPSSYGYIEGATWDQVGVKKPTQQQDRDALRLASNTNHFRKL